MTSDPLTLIPVIDLLGGQVVRAVRGDRASYRPVRSALCAGSDPVEVARALCDHCASKRLYVADLDALTGKAVQLEAIATLLRALPDTEVWLDAAFADRAAADALLARLAVDAARVVPVFGSESIVSPTALEHCFAARDGERPQGAQAALSLDRRDGQRLDAAGCWDAPDRWPARVIVMTLERVGSGSGPDLGTMADVRRRAPPGTELIGAGGVRSFADLAAASAAGADAWLVASALHDLQLPRVARSGPDGRGVTG